MTTVYSLVVALAVVVVFLGALVVGLLKSHAEVLKRLDSLGVRLDEPGGLVSANLEAPGRGIKASVGPGLITGWDPKGNSAVLSLSAGSNKVLLAFLSTSCSSCSMFWEHFVGAFLNLADERYRVAVITLSPSEESPTRAARLAARDTEVVMSSEAWSTFEVPGAPYFVVVDPETQTILGEGTAGTVSALEGFIRDAEGDRQWDMSLNDRKGKDRESRIDAELRNAGIEPGDPKLYPSQPQESDGE